LNESGEIARGRTRERGWNGHAPPWRSPPSSPGPRRARGVLRTTPLLVTSAPGEWPEGELWHVYRNLPGPSSSSWRESPISRSPVAERVECRSALLFLFVVIETPPSMRASPHTQGRTAPLGLGSSRSTPREETTRDGRPARAPRGLRGGGRDRGHRFRVRRARRPRAASRGRAVGGRLVRAALAPRAPGGASRVRARARQTRTEVRRPQRALRHSDHRRRRDGRGRGAGRGDAGFARGAC